MQIDLEIPDEISAIFGSDLHSVKRALLEGLALEGVRSGRLSRGQVRRLLGFGTRYEVDGFLKEHGIPLEESLEEIRQASEQILAHGRQ
jgi:hypothetical protein